MAVKRFSYANTERVRAEARHVRTSPRKIRLVLDEIRGRSVVDARARLLFSPRDAAKDVELVLRSAVTNAEVNHGLSPDDLVVDEAYANEGMTIKRFRPRARGRASRINKRTSHIVIVLRSVEGEEIVATATVETPDASRSRRVAASRKQADVDETAEAGEETTDEAAEATAEAEVETAPKPTRSRAKKAEAAEGEEKPKPTRSRAKKADDAEAAVETAPKRTRAKKADDAEAAVETAPKRTRAKKADAAEAGEDKPKPTRSRAKKTETAEAEAGAEEKKPRSRAKKTEAAEGEEKPKPTRSRAKKTETDDGEEA